MLAVFSGCLLHDGAEVSVEASRGIVSAFVGDTKYVSFAVFQKIAGLVYTVSVYVICEGDARSLLEVAGQVDVVVRRSLRKSDEGTFTRIIPFHEIKYLLQKLGVFRGTVAVYRRSVKGSADRV